MKSNSVKKYKTVVLAVIELCFSEDIISQAGRQAVRKLIPLNIYFKTFVTTSISSGLGNLSCSLLV